MSQDPECDLVVVLAEEDGHGALSRLVVLGSAGDGEVVGAGSEVEVDQSLGGELPLRQRVGRDALVHLRKLHERAHAAVEAHGLAIDVEPRREGLLIAE